MPIEHERGRDQFMRPGTQPLGRIADVPDVWRKGIFSYEGGAGF